VTGSQSTAFVAEARQIVAEGVNAKITGKASLDVILFAGNGATSTVELLIDCLGIKQHTSSPSSNKNNRPIVFVGPYEHHSNLLPWRESGCEIITIPECPLLQNVDIPKLEEMLRLHKDNGGHLKMGAFTAASNVTGKVCDVDRIAALLHRYGALAFFDYATGAPYLPMDMNPSIIRGDHHNTNDDVSKDAMFISPHKMLGGVNTPGILVVKKHLVNQTAAPSRSGGGTVFYVTHTHHRFLSNRIERYEGGTPNVIGIVRAGLTFLVKRKAVERYMRAVGVGAGVQLVVRRTMEEYEYRTHSEVVKRLRRTAPNLVMLGQGISGSDSGGDRGSHLPIFSFLIKCGHRFLHYNYVCAILNDLFGIQSRGGCQCSGPYSQRLLGLTKIQNGVELPNENNQRIEYALLHLKERAELLRPGYSRLSLPFKGLRKEEAEYVIKALEWVAKNGWALICQYRCNHRTGEWRHFSRQGKPLGRAERRWLSHYDTHLTHATKKEETVLPTDGTYALTLQKALENADLQLTIARTDQRCIVQALKMTDEDGILGKDSELDGLRWYVYPKECAHLLKEGAETVPGTDSVDVFGSIHPIGFYGMETEIKDVIVPIEKVTFGGIASSVNANINDVEPIELDNAKQQQPIDLLSGDSILQFRDGENHSGVAPFDDIIAGFDDGELSDRCLVYNSKEDCWLPVEQLLGKRKKAKNDSMMVPTTASEKQVPEEMDIDIVSEMNSRPANMNGAAKVDKK